jgi:predicted MFS family arabinose efflux permease
MGMSVQNRSASWQRTILLLAIAGGTAVMNVFFNQPLLADIAASFHVSARAVSSIPTFTQIGFAIGVILFVPLGDMVQRRRLIPIMLAGIACGLIAAAVAPNLTWLCFASLAIGLTTVIHPIVVSFAAQITAPPQRGKAVGTVLGSIFTGMLLSRTVGGFVGAYFGWRTVYWLAAGLMIVLAVILSMLLPKSQSATISYPQLMRSLPKLFVEQPVLRQTVIIGAMQFGVFNAFWTTLVFLLSTPPYHYGSEVTGLFGLVGIVGATAAPLVGRLADKKGPRLTVGLAILIIALAYVVFWLFGYNLWGLIAGVILLDLGVQAGLVSNQARIYTLLPETYNSRLNTVYALFYYLGGALGSTLGAYGWSVWQWRGVCIVGFLMLVVAFATYLWFNRTGQRPPTWY